MHLLVHSYSTVQCKGCRLCKQHVHIAGNAAHAHLLHPVCARGHINQPAQKLVSLLAVSLERLV